MKQTFLYFCYSFILLAFFQFPNPASAQEEKILSFHSDIRIDTSGMVRINEHIKVYANGDKIQRGIVRAIPLYRKDKFGNSKKIDFEITKVLRGGKTENYSTVESDGNRSIYIGNSDVMLETGIYEYDIAYQSKGHVGFFEGYDELYWNVTGNEWIFPIDTASATLHFPGTAVSGNTSCYTGSSGSKASNCNLTKNPDGSINFTTTQALDKYQGFTIAAAFTPGLIKRPSFKDKLYTEYKELLITAFLLFIMAAYFFFTWKKYGVDPAGPVVVPTFNVPGKLSPAVLRYFYKQKTDDKSFAIALVSMAVKKTVKISQDEQKNYQLKQSHTSTAALAKEEKVIYDNLFLKEDQLEINNENGKTFFETTALYHKSLKKQIDLATYFLKNNGLLVKGSLLTAAVLITFIVFVDTNSPLAMLFFIPFFLAGVTFLYLGITQFRSSRGSSIIRLWFGLLLTFGPLYFLFIGFSYIPPVTVTFLAGTITMFTIYVYLIKAPTVAGTVMLSEIEGFKMYLETAEEQRLNLLNPPELSPQLFEKFLPYAMALDVENAWGARFESLLSSVNYTPEWFAGNSLSYATFGSIMAKPFGNALKSSTSSYAPAGSGSSSGSSGSSSYSSGSSGGGSSGGGGGGGGGGGW